MQVLRQELENLLGMAINLAHPFRANYVSADGDRRAYIGLDLSGTLQAEVTDHAFDDAESVVAFSGDYDVDGDGFSLVSEDHTGDASDVQDPRSALVSFRRITRGMVTLA